MTREELAQQAGVSAAFVAEAEAAGLVRPQRWGYRPRLVNWLAKLHRLRTAGMTWEEIRDWSKRRFEPGHEHERRWPAGYQPDR